MVKKRSDQSYLYQRAIKLSTMKRIRKESRKLRKLIFQECNLLNEDINIALEMLPENKKQRYQSIITGKYAEEQYEKIIKAQILYYFFEGESRTSISQIYAKTPKEITDTIESFGFSRTEQYRPSGKAKFVVGTKVFNSIKKAKQFKEETDSPYKIVTIGEQEVILYHYLEKHHIQLEDIATNILETKKIR